LIIIFTVLEVLAVHLLGRH